MGMYPGEDDIKQEQMRKTTFKQRHKQLKQKKTNEAFVHKEGK